MGDAVLVLASASPRRAELLTKAGLTFEVDAAGIDESLSRRLGLTDGLIDVAKRKARVVAERHPGAFVLAADTVIVRNDEVLGKPADAEEATQALRRLSGREHRVLTAVVVLAPDGARFSDVVETRVTFKELDRATIEAYVATGEPLDKAGSYAIQGKGAELVEAVEGSWTNVVGLPVTLTLELLAEAGFEAPA